MFSGRVGPFTGRLNRKMEKLDLQWLYNLTKSIHLAQHLSKLHKFQFGKFTQCVTNVYKGYIKSDFTQTHKAFKDKVYCSVPQKSQNCNS